MLRQNCGGHLGLYVELYHCFNKYFLFGFNNDIFDFVDPENIGIDTNIVEIG